jgi:hypothetical protein
MVVIRESARDSGEQGQRRATHEDTTRVLAPEGPHAILPESGAFT